MNIDLSNIAISNSRSSLLRNPSSKNKHLHACLFEDVAYKKQNGFQQYELLNDAFPTISLANIDLSTNLGSIALPTPLVISPTTGGTKEGHDFLIKFAQVCERNRLALCVGSQRVAIEQEDRAQFFKVRDYAPSIKIFANLGAGQIAKGWGIKEVMQAIRMIEADAIFIHMNSVQEAVQGGDRDFSSLENKLNQLCNECLNIGVPVFAREVCFGMTTETAERLINCGIQGLDCSGAGGTSWARVESFCTNNDSKRALCHAFSEWGICTADSIVNVRRADQSIPLIASGGISNGIEIALALALGANAAGIARPLLISAQQGVDALDQHVKALLEQLRIAMFGCGAQAIHELPNKLFKKTN